jgi:nitroreductase
VLSGGALAGAVLLPRLGWTRRVKLGSVALQPWSLPEHPPAGEVELARVLVGAAILAPNHWNSQPWRFEIEGPSVRLVADTRRSLPACDPDQRCLHLSLGAALENLLVAARSYGLRPKVTYFGRPGLVAEVSWTNNDVRRDRALAAAISERRTNRREYDGRGIFPQNRAQLLAQGAEGVRMHWLDDERGMRAVSDLAFEAVRDRMRDRRIQAERFAWMRFSDGEARRKADGVSVEALELGGPARWLAHRYFDPESWMRGLGADSIAKQQRGGVRSAGALLLITGLRQGDRQRVMAGQVYERFALEATQLGIAHQPIDEPIASDRTRGALLERFGVSGEEPLMLVRLGHAKRPKPTPRRAVALVASFRNS